MGALTKAEMAERLYEELGLNKREAKELVELFLKKFGMRLKITSRSSCPVSATSTFATNASGRAATPRQGRDPDRTASSPFVQGRSWPG
jgi:nucleoid DNA-binding protein